MPKSRPPYSPEFRQQIIELAQAGRTPDELAKEFEPSAQTIRSVLSTTLVFEYEEVLKRAPDTLGLTDQEIETLLDDLCHRSDHQIIYFLWRPCLSDPKDDHILELAVASETSLIVTHNIKDFKKATEFGIRIITPSQLLEELK